jgi:hypothetical protein
MFHYLENKINLKNTKKQKLDFFYWKYIYGDIIISKFINFLVKSGYKNRAIKFFFKALFNLKSKFGINPILLIKYVILKRNVLHKVTKKKVKQKTFFYLRLLDFDRQISNTIRKIMELIFFLKEKKSLKLWQSIFVVLLNFCIVKNKKKVINNFNIDTVRYQKIISRMINRFRVNRSFSELNDRYVKLYIILQKTIFLLATVSNKYVVVGSYLFLNRNEIDFSLLSFVFYFFSCIKMVSYYLWVIKYRLFRLKKRFLIKFKKFRIKIYRFFFSFRQLRRKYNRHRIRQFKLYKLKRYLLKKNKALLRSKFRQHFLTRFFFKELGDLKKASKFKNSFLNFKLLNKKKRELKIGTRIHQRYDVRLRHRKIFFRVSKYGQIKK